jgi:hypothetical protein
MKRITVKLLIACAVLGASTLVAQIKETKGQILFYTSDWKGDRFPDGRPKVPDNLLSRALDVSIEDVWDYLRGQGYENQFESGWQALHIEKPFAGRPSAGADSEWARVVGEPPVAQPEKTMARRMTPHRTDGNFAFMPRDDALNAATPP